MPAHFRPSANAFWWNSMWHRATFANRCDTNQVVDLESIVEMRRISKKQFHFNAHFMRQSVSTLSATNSMPSLAFTSRTWIRCWLQPFDLCSQHDRHVRNIECDVHWNLLVHSIFTASARESTEAAFNLIARTVLVGRNNYSKYKTPYMCPSSVHSQSTAIETMPKPERADEHSKHDSFQLDFLALLPMRCRYI